MERVASIEPPDEGSWPARRWWAIGLILVVLAIMLVPTARRYVDQRAQIAALREQISRSQKTVDALARERARWDDPAFVEAQARERLHFVKPGETGYTLTTSRDEPPATVDTQVVGVAAADQSLPWYAKVWGSLGAADRLGEQVRSTPSDPAQTPAGEPADGGASPVPTITDTGTPVPTTSTRSRR